jgi:hypothetical protein
MTVDSNLSKARVCFAKAKEYMRLAVVTRDHVDLPLCERSSWRRSCARELLRDALQLLAEESTQS